MCKSCHRSSTQRVTPQSTLLVCSCVLVTRLPVAMAAVTKHPVLLHATTPTGVESDWVFADVNIFDVLPALTLPQKLQTLFRYNVQEKRHSEADRLLLIGRSTTSDVPEGARRVVSLLTAWAGEHEGGIVRVQFPAVKDARAHGNGAAQHNVAVTLEANAESAAVAGAVTAALRSGALLRATLGAALTLALRKCCGNNLNLLETLRVVIATQPLVPRSIAKDLRTVVPTEYDESFVRVLTARHDFPAADMVKVCANIVPALHLLQQRRWGIYKRFKIVYVEANFRGRLTAAHGKSRAAHAHVVDSLANLCKRTATGLSVDVLASELTCTDSTPRIVVVAWDDDLCHNVAQCVPEMMPDGVLVEPARDTGDICLPGKGVEVLADLLTDACLSTHLGHQLGDADMPGARSELQVLERHFGNVALTRNTLAGQLEELGLDPTYDLNHDLFDWAADLDDNETGGVGEAYSGSARTVALDYCVERVRTGPAVVRVPLFNDKRCNHKLKDAGTVRAWKGCDSV